jgi:hypothetical protein
MVRLGEHDFSQDEMMKRKILTLVSAVVLAGGMGAAGWWFGHRDGMTYAYAEVGGERVSCHVAVKSGDTATAEKVIETLTGDSVSLLLDGRHSFPLFFENPNRANRVLAMLRAAWSPRSKHFSSRIQHPHRSPAGRDYAGEFQGIQPADEVRIAAKYEGVGSSLKSEVSVGK